MRRLAPALLTVLVAGSAAAQLPAKPSRSAIKGCAWEKASDPAVGLAAWVERCDLGARKIDLFLRGSSLLVRWSDGGSPEPVVNVFDLKEGEKPETGIRRVFAAKTEPKVASRCVLVAYRGPGTKPRPGVKRFTFVPDVAYAKELEKTQSPDEVGEPPCGDLGESPDGIGYFEAQAEKRRFLWVMVGQDEPLFDEETLTILP